MSIRVYTSKHCPPCQDIERLVKAGKFEEDIELVDIETDEGFKEFTEKVLKGGGGEVPSAYKEGRKCQIGFAEDGILVFDCPKDDPDADQKD